MGACSYKAGAQHGKLPRNCADYSVMIVNPAWSSKNHRKMIEPSLPLLGLAAQPSDACGFCGKIFVPFVISHVILGLSERLVGLSLGRRRLPAHKGMVSNHLHLDELAYSTR